MNSIAPTPRARRRRNRHRIPNPFIQQEPDLTHRSFSEFSRDITIPFKSNSAFAFLNFGDAYHGVEPIDRPVERWNLQYTIDIERTSSSSSL